MDKLKNRIKKNSFVISAAITSFLLLVMIVFLFPLEFSGYRNTDTLAPIWYVITLTGGFYGGTAIIFCLLVFLIIHFKKSERKSGHVYLFISIVFSLQIIVTGFTQFYAKNYFKSVRPTQLYFVEKGFIDKDETEYFELRPSDRSEYLQKKLDSIEKNLSEVYPPILQSWVSESGYSFPSGHSQTSFFLGTIVAFMIFKLQSKKLYIFFPLIWAILVSLSRVVIGVHYTLDIAAGAFIGLVFGIIVITLKKVNQIFS